MNKPLTKITIDVVTKGSSEPLVRVDWNAAQGGGPDILRNVPPEDVADVLAAALLVLAEQLGNPELTITIGGAVN